MIQLKKLVLKNFKSFKKAEIPIARGFTAIVGSNGSGKSNILDALLFVLGISSLKALRASRMTDLVNNQSTEDYAKVELELEDKEKQKKWVISRTVDKQGRAVVRLDDKRVGLNEVTSLLDELGITATGHNIVVQGDITRIMEMNPIQRRELIDEIAGIREFDEKREESFKELEKVDQKIKEVRIVLSERETYLQELSKEREAALEFNRLNTEIQQTKATLFKGELAEIEEGMKKIASRQEEHQKELSEKNLGLEEGRKELEQLEQSLEETNQKIISASEKTYSGLGFMVEEKKSELKVRSERKNSFLEAIAKNDGKIKVLRERNLQIGKELEQKNKLLLEKEPEIRGLEKELALEQKNQQEKRQKWAEKSKELKELEARQREEEEKLDSQRSLFFEKQGQLQALQKTIELKKQSLADWLNEKKRLEERLEDRQKKKSLLDSLLQKEPFPEKSLEENEKKLRETGQKQAYVESRQDSVNEAVKQLEKSMANCPTCDSELSATTKQRLLNQKKGEWVKLSREQESFQEQKKGLLEEREHLKEVLKKKSELEFGLADFAELFHKKGDLEAKIQKLKTETDDSLLSKLEGEKAFFEKKVQELEGSVEECESLVQDFRKQYDFESAASASQKLEQLSRKLNELKGQKKQLELETSLVLTEETKSNLKNCDALDRENQDWREKLETEEKQLSTLQRELEKLEVELVKAEKSTKELTENKQHLLEKLSQQKQKNAKVEIKIKETETALNQCAVDSSRLEVRQADLREEAKEFAEVPAFESFDLRELRQKLPELEKKIKKMGAINQKAIDHFGEFEQELLEVKKKSDKLEEERLAVLDMIKKIEDRRTQVFMDCFNAINRHFNDIFFTLADGEGKLSLLEPERPLESGLSIEARLKGKQIYGIDSMSGGEKTLTSLAFLFAIQMYNPAPFYVFDEADAALDKENSLRLGKIVGQISRNSQFIGITHNDTIVREANQIIGVALNEQKSSVIGLKLKEKEEAKNN